jgi:quercetin dioxygenase-like cupin family protein
MPTPPQAISATEGRTLNVLGNELVLKVTGGQTGGAFELYTQTNPPGAGVPPHVHTREDETFYVVSGRVRFFVGDTWTEVGPGTTLWAPRDVAHGYQVVGQEPGVLLFTVSPPNLEPMFAELSALPPGPPDFSKIAEICGRYGISFVM